MPEDLSRFIDLQLFDALQVIILGFIGGTLSGFIGSGGAFFMTPGMMNLGVPGVVAVASNVAHKFGKAMMGSKRHSEMGNVDKKLGICLILTAFLGNFIAVLINDWLFAGKADSHGGGSGGAAADLYISVVFVSVLTLVAISMLRDVWKTAKDEMGPSRVITDFLARLRLSPMIYFPVADVRISLWILLIVGLATGYLAGTIGVGGFIGVPAMIYVFGLPTTVAAGTELFLAMFMGAFLASNYVYLGYVDLRLTLLLYVGSLLGINVGVYGTKVVKELVIRLVTAIVILLCVISRAVAIPTYLRQLHWIDFDPGWDIYFNQASKIMLFVSGSVGVGVILYNVFKAYRLRRRIHAELEASPPHPVANENVTT